MAIWCAALGAKRSAKGVRIRRTLARGRWQAKLCDPNAASVALSAVQRTLTHDLCAEFVRAAPATLVQTQHAAICTYRHLAPAIGQCVVNAMRPTAQLVVASCHGATMLSLEPKTLERACSLCIV